MHVVAGAGTSGSGGNAYLRAGATTGIGGGVDVRSGVGSTESGSVNVASASGSEVSGKVALTSGSSSTLSGTLTVASGDAARSGDVAVLAGSATPHWRKVVGMFPYAVAVAARAVGPSRLTQLPALQTVVVCA